MNRMQNDLRDGECYIYANNRSEYDAFTAWLCSNGGQFAYHFETGEAYWYRGKIVEVYGLE